MNVKVEALDQHKVSVGIELPAEVVQKGFKKRYPALPTR